MIFLWNLWNVLMSKKMKKDAHSRSPGRDNQITTSTKIFHIKHELYGFIGDLKDIININAVRLCFSRVVYRFCCYV